MAEEFGFVERSERVVTGLRPVLAGSFDSAQDRLRPATTQACHHTSFSGRALTGRFSSDFYCGGADWLTRAAWRRAGLRPFSGRADGATSGRRPCQELAESSWRLGGEAGRTVRAGTGRSREDFG